MTEPSSRVTVSTVPRAGKKGLRVSGVEKWYRKGKKGAWFQVLSDISFHVHDGELVAIIGLSGCGKTTLLRICAGLIPRDGGEITLDAEPVDEVPDNIGFVFQDAALLSWETVWHNIELGLGPNRLTHAEKDRLVKRAMDLVGLSDFGNSFPYQLSGGMQQRAGLARALIGEPRLLLLDEPLGSLDAFTRARLQDELTQLLSQLHITTLLVTHDVEEALFLADRIVVMSSSPGRIKSVLDVPAPRPRARFEFLAAPEIVKLKADIASMIMG